MKDVGRSGKTVVSFIISVLIFSLAAILFAGAFSYGRDNPSITENDKKPNVDGESFNLLLAMSDYTPEIFSDYDPDSVKKVHGISVSTTTQASSVLSGYKKVFVERMVIIRFDKDLGEIVFIPISGNTLVNYKGLQLRIGEIAGEWGITPLVEKLHAITGLRIDNFAFFTPRSAASAIDLAGSVDYTVKCNMKQSIPEKGIDIDIIAGTYRVDGKTAVDMIRFDGYENTGISRSDIISGYVKRVLNNVSSALNDVEREEKILQSLELSYNDFGSVSLNDKMETVLKLGQFEMVYEEPAGSWQTVQDVRYFVLDETKTIQKFIKYRNK